MAAQLAFSFDLFDQPAPRLLVTPIPRRCLVDAVESAIVTKEEVWQPLISAEKQPVIIPVRFRVTNKMLVGGTPQTKYEANVKAIRTLDRLVFEKRAPSEEELFAIAQYAGWGAIPQAFASDVKADWKQRGEVLRSLLGDRLAAARASTPNAHFTPLHVIDSIWQAISRMGFTGGRVLEPSAGIGHFIGRMPDALRATSQVTAVELEPISGSMVSTLYPEVDVRVCGFEKFSAPKASFDLAIGNVPFGDYRVFDPSYDQHKLYIHDYFIMKCCELVRPGGLVALITSTGTMDSHKSFSFRKWVNRYAEIVSVIRLPNGTFAQSANTEVATDIWFLKVQKFAHNPDLTEYASDEELKLGRHGSHVRGVNGYWIKYPRNVLGQWAIMSTQYGKREGVMPPADIAGALRAAVDNLPAGKFEKSEPSHISPVFSMPGSNEGELQHNDSGTLCRYESGTWKPLPSRECKKVSHLYALGTFLKRLLDEQNSESCNEVDMELLRSQLNETYNGFVSEFGALSRRPNVLSVKNWSMLPLLLSLEHFDERKQTATKAAIFSERTTAFPKLATHADSLESALMICLGESLSIQLPRIAGLLSLTIDEVSLQLEEKGLAYFDPVAGQHILAEEYLSGDVREKLAQVETYARNDKRFMRNRSALKLVMPTMLMGKDIAVQLGAPWIPIDVIRDFVVAVTDCADAQVTRSSALSKWSVKAYPTPVLEARWGHLHVSVAALVQYALNGQRPTIYAGDPDDRIVDSIQTAAARDRLERIQKEFQRWVWGERHREELLVEIYNQRFNSIVPRKYDGKFLTFPGKSSAVILRESQTEAIARGLIGGPTGIFHKTGAGKTMILCAIAHEAKRLGLARKSVIVVQNSTLYQFAAEYLRLYPAARILVPDRDELSGTRRRSMLAKIATGDWEAIIVAHSSLDRLSMGIDAIRQVGEYLCEPLDAELATAQSCDIKQLEKQRARITEMLERLSNQKLSDGHLKFEDLGIDNMLIDEAHRFKNLWYYTGRARVAGMQVAASKRALDLLAKTHWLYSRHKRPYGLTLATATPITNTIAEIYTMQRFLQPHILRNAGLENFDAWASMFGQVVSSVEISPTGRGFRVHERFARFHNVPELMRMYLQSADIKHKGHLSAILNEPSICGGKPTLVVAKCHPLQSEYIDSLVERARLIKETKVDPTIDNMLKIVHEGRMVALDTRLMVPHAPDWDGAKVNLAVNRIFRHWQEGKDSLTTQLVFSDLSVPQKNGAWSIYEDIKAKLMTRGVPDEEIAFAQFAETDRARAMLFQKLRDGHVRIALGSTERLGTGANVQNRLIAMHHLDVPWRPSDLEQRDGRGIRNGNMHEEIYIYRYVTEQSFDAYMWQTTETKAKFILQAMDPEMKLRTVEDIATATLSYAEVKAAASGDPTVIEKIGIDAELAKLNLLARAEQSRFQELRWRQSGYQRRVEECEQRAVALTAWVNKHIDAPQPKSIFLLRLNREYDLAQLPDDRFSLAFGDSTEINTVGVARYGAINIFRSAGNTFLVEVPTENSRSVFCDIGSSHSVTGFKRMLGNIFEQVTKEIQYQQQQSNLDMRGSEEINVQLALPWEHQERFDSLLKRQLEINEILGLHRDENTAGMSESASTSEEEETDEEIEEIAA